MSWILVKYLVTAGVVVLVSEVARHSDRVGALIASLPMVTLLAMIWLTLESQPPEKIANHAWYTFWYVIPTLPMFFLFPWLMSRLGFWMALLAAIGITMACFVLFALAVKPLGVELF